MAQTDPWAVVDVKTASPPPSDPWAVASVTPDRKHTNLTENKKGEGVYTMHGNGYDISVPYSKIGDAIENGYAFSGTEEKERFAKDYTAGEKPNWSKHKSIQQALGMPVEDTTWNRARFAASAAGKDLWDSTSGTPVRGVANEGRRTLAGMIDMFNGYDAGSISDVNAYLREHPHATDQEALDAVEGKNGQKPYRAPESERSREKAKSVANGLRQDSESHGLWEDVGSVGEQVGEIAIPESVLGKLAEGGEVARGVSEAAKAQKVARVLDRYPRLKALVTFGIKAASEGARGAVEQGAQGAVKSGGDVKETAEAAGAGAIGGATGHALVETAGTAVRGAGNALRGVMGVGESETAETVRKAARDARKAEVDAADEDATQASAHGEQVRSAVHENEGKELEHGRKVETARQEAEEANRTAAANHQEQVQGALHENQGKELEHEARVKAAREKADADYAQAVADAKETESTRGRLARQEIQLRDRLFRRVQQIKTLTKANIDGQWDRIRKAIGDRTSDLKPLVDAVDRAKKEFKGSQEKIREFQDILSRAKQDSGTDDLREATARSNFSKPYIKLSPVQRSTVDRAVQEAEDEYARKRGEDVGPEQIDFTHLRGYSTELGKLLRSPSLDGDVRQAIVIVRNEADAMAQKLADKAGVGAKLRRAKDDYKTFMETFYEPSGTSGSGSQMAQAVSAADAFHGTEPFLNDEPSVANRARQLLTGKQGSPHYDPNAGKLLDNLRGVKREQEALPKPKTPEYAEPKPVEPPPRTPIPDRPEHIPPKPVDPPPRTPIPDRPEQVKPKYRKLTPQQIEEEKQERIYQFAKRLQHFGPYMAMGAITGFIGGLSSLASGHDPYRAAEFGGAGFLLGPYAVRTLIEKPWVIEKLSKVTQADLKQMMKLPREQREGVETMLVQLAIDAKNRGALKAESPWMRIISGETIKKVEEYNRQQTQETNEDDLDSQE